MTDAPPPPAAAKEEEDNTKSVEKSKPPTNKHKDLSAPDHLRRRKRLEQTNRWLLVLFQSLATVFLIGATLGWGPMQLLLEENGNYASECTAEERQVGLICEDQTARLLTIGLVIGATKLVTPLLGYLMDRGGPQTSAWTMAACGSTGMVLVALAMGNEARKLDAFLYAGFPLLGIATWIGSLLIVQLGFYFQGHLASRIIFVLNTLFDSGTLTYWFLWFIHDTSGVEPIRLWSGYTIFAAGIYAALVYFWSVASKEPAAQDENPFLSESKHMAISRSQSRNSSSFFSSSRHQSIVNRSQRGNNSSAFFSPSRQKSVVFLEEGMKDTKKIKPEHTEREDTKPTESEEASNGPSCPPPLNYTIVAERTHAQQLTSPLFLLLCAFYGIQCSSVDWNISTQRDFLAYLGDDDEGNVYLTIFTLLTPVSILAAPLMDHAILKYGWIGALQCINVLSFAFSLIKVVSDDLNVQIIGFALFSIYRGFLFGVSFSFLPHVVAGQVVGRAVGVMNMFAGAAFLITYPLAKSAINTFEGDFFIPNVVYVILCVPSTLSIWGVSHYMAKEEAVLAAQA
eukprot:scaffold336_cov196-Amphora_coffeaeformis.AAC.1